MTLPPLSTLLAIAQAASDVPISAVGALAHYEQTFSPSTCLALLDRIRQLEAVLVEALDHWEGWDSGSGTSADCDRIAELRKLATGGTVER